MSGGATDESFYYAPYNSLLNIHFPLNENYSVWPQYRTPIYNELIDFGVVYIVQKTPRPCFFLEANMSNAVFDISTRGNADRQMRMKFAEFLSKLRISILHSLSAIGTHLAFYSLDKETHHIKPDEIPKKTSFVNYVAFIQWWQDDVLQPDGETRLLQVVEDVKTMLCSRNTLNNFQPNEIT